MYLVLFATVVFSLLLFAAFKLGAYWNGFSQRENQLVRDQNAKLTKQNYFYQRWRKRYSERFHKELGSQSELAAFIKKFNPQFAHLMMSRGVPPIVAAAKLIEDGAGLQKQLEHSLQIQGSVNKALHERNVEKDDVVFLVRELLTLSAKVGKRGWSKPKQKELDTLLGKLHSVIPAPASTPQNGVTIARVEGLLKGVYGQAAKKEAPSTTALKDLNASRCVN